MSKLDAKLISDLITFEKNQDDVKVRQLVLKAAQRLAEVLADNEVLRQQGSDFQ